MSNVTFSSTDTLFSVGAVEEELEKIFHDPHFTESAILRKFLSFIVQETIQGRANRLKEYTIAVNVLEKPMNFNPQENGIVRIHAGRLRRALSEYYNDVGRNDKIVITIPKGKYVPVFANPRDPKDAAIIDKELRDEPFVPDSDAMIIAILPFIWPSKIAAVRSFADGLCLQIGVKLMKLDKISVIAYQAVKNLAETQPDYKELGASVGFNYAISGGVQFLNNKIRVNAELIECTSYMQLWSETYEYKLTRNNLFDIQDEICRYIVSEVDELCGKKYSGEKLLAHS
jgi:TolB-like protein